MRDVVNLAVLDNDALVIAALPSIVTKGIDRCRVSWATTDSKDAVSRCLDPVTRPDLLLADIQLSKSESGIRACREIRSQIGVMPILLMTALNADSFAYFAAATGAQGIVDKAPISTLCEAIRTVLDGEIYTPRAGAPFEDAHNAYRRLTFSHGEWHGPLTRCEARVMDRLIEGKTLKQIALELEVAPTTVRTQAIRAKAKLHADNLGQAAILWHQMRDLL
ncbi:response regulator transcription factor [Bifidobacterium jacchi]|uniref:DNA-binding response regulator n=1 Tax=Bifidobacterium jacchi TaxID=2490545 RepID=A0A5N5RKA6_9BIFI|nr:response regulator transcription factor [Bifidobacterium jacchi]KAB5607726.1 DNA-binding response regulator [Bifidobacterium jacchi]